MTADMIDTARTCNCALCVEFFGQPDAPPRYHYRLDWETCADCGEVWTRRAWPVCPECNRIDPSAESVRFIVGRWERFDCVLDYLLFDGRAPIADLMDEPYRKIVRPE